MPPADNDVAHLWDMLTTAREALSYVARVDEETYLQDPVLYKTTRESVPALIALLQERLNESGGS